MRHAVQTCVRAGKILLMGTIFLGAASAAAQIGGKTASDGPFLLENVEDLDTTAGGVLRAWVPDRVPTEKAPLQAVLLTTTGLTLASGQSPDGTLRFTMPTDFGFVKFGFGVPMPSLPGASTETHPGDLTTFRYLTFLISASIDLIDQQKQVILECYPGSGSVFPKLHWNYELAAGPEFHHVAIDLWNPTSIQNGNSSTVSELLAQSRFLYFYFYGGPEATAKTQVVHVDDIRLVSTTAAGPDWALY